MGLGRPRGERALPRRRLAPQVVPKLGRRAAGVLDSPHPREVEKLAVHATGLGQSHARGDAAGAADLRRRGVHGRQALDVAGARQAAREH
jgi:hypothetical protein